MTSTLYTKRNEKHDSSCLSHYASRMCIYRQLTLYNSADHNAWDECPFHIPIKSDDNNMTITSPLEDFSLMSTILNHLLEYFCLAFGLLQACSGVTLALALLLLVTTASRERLHLIMPIFSRSKKYIIISSLLTIHSISSCISLARIKLYTIIPTNNLSLLKMLTCAFSIGSIDSGRHPNHCLIRLELACWDPRRKYLIQLL